MILLEEKLYTSEETASILGISLRTLYRYLKKGEIEAETKTQSGTFRFTRKQIYKYLYPDKYAEIINKLKLNDSTNSSNITYIDDEDFKNLENSKNTLPKPVEPVETHKEENLSPTAMPVAPTPISEEVLNISKPVDPTVASKIIEKRTNTDLSDELDSLEVLLGSQQPVNNAAPAQNNPVSSQQNPQSVVKDPDISQIPISSQPEIKSTLDTTSTSPSTEPSNIPVQPVVKSNTAPNVQVPVLDKWLYFVNTDKDILDLAREINSLSSETGRKYAATMKGGLSLHHDINEFNLVHFYVLNEVLNWYVEQLELKPSTETEANICLIPTSDTTIFDSSYKLRGLNVVSDSRLIQDLMSHNEKELAKTLL